MVNEEIILQNKSGIYMILNTVNNKKYIGSTSRTLKQRKAEHVSDLRNNKHHSDHLQKSYNKYGEDSFEFIVIEYIEDKSKLIEREQLWIDYYHSTNGKHGYNVRKIAESNLGIKRTEQYKQNMRDVKKDTYCGEDNWNYGKCLTEEHINKLSISHKKYYEINRSPMFGKHHTEETKEKIRINKKGKIGPNLGKHFSEDTKNKMSKVRKGKQMGSQSPIAKPIINLDTNETFVTIKSAAKYYHINDRNICSVCQNKRKTAGGYHWSYLNTA
jgi:group I intron endonuclease